MLPPWQGLYADAQYSLEAVLSVSTAFSPEAAFAKNADKNKQKNIAESLVIYLEIYL